MSLMRFAASWSEQTSQSCGGRFVRLNESGNDVEEKKSERGPRESKKRKQKRNRKEKTSEIKERNGEKSAPRRRQ